MGRQDIAVAKGADRPLIKPAAFASEIHGESGLDGRNYRRHHHVKQLQCQHQM